MMRPSQVKIGLAVLFVTIIVPLLTVTILRGYLQYLWARKNDEESSGFTNTTIFDILKDLKNFFWENLHPTAWNDTAFSRWCDLYTIISRWFSPVKWGCSRASSHTTWFSTNWLLNWHGTNPASSPSKSAHAPNLRGLMDMKKDGSYLVYLPS